MCDQNKNKMQLIKFLKQGLLGDILSTSAKAEADIIESRKANQRGVTTPKNEDTLKFKSLQTTEIETSADSVEFWLTT